MNRIAHCCVWFGLLLITSPNPCEAQAPPETAPPETQASANAEKAAKPKTPAETKAWKKLEDQWKACQFGGDGDITIKGNSIAMEIGDPITGVQWKGDTMTENYEIELEARRVEGFDFFCGLTFPVGKDHVTFVMGGWGGGIVGISNVNGVDASENETTYYRTFKNEQWYKVRVRVDPYQITTWIDDSESVELPRKDREFAVRFEMELCMPLGLAAYQCKSEFRNLRIRKITEAEIGAAKKRAEALAAELGQ